MRSAVALLVGTWQLADAAPRLVELLGDSVPAVRISAVRALAALGRVEEALGLVSDPDEWVRDSVAMAVADAFDSQHVDAMIPLLADREDHVSLRAVIAVGELAPPAQVAELVAPLLADPECDVRGASAHALVGVRAHERIDDLLPLLQDGDDWAAYVLWALECLAALVPSRRQDLVAAVAPRLADSRIHVRGPAARVLATLKATEQADAIEALLDVESRSFRDAAFALARLGETARLLRWLEVADQPDKRWIVVQALGAVHATEQSAAIALLLGHEDTGVRADAAAALALLEASDHAPDVAPLLEDPDSLTRHMAALALVELGPPDDLRERTISVLDGVVGRVCTRSGVGYSPWPSRTEE